MRKITAKYWRYTAWSGSWYRYVRELHLESGGVVKDLQASSRLFTRGSYCNDNPSGLYNSYIGDYATWYGGWDDTEGCYIYQRLWMFPTAQELDLIVVNWYYLPDWWTFSYSQDGITWIDVISDVTYGTPEYPSFDQGYITGYYYFYPETGVSTEVSSAVNTVPIPSTGKKHTLVCGGALVNFLYAQGGGIDSGISAIHSTSYPAAYKAYFTAGNIPSALTTYRNIETAAAIIGFKTVVLPTVISGLLAVMPVSQERSSAISSNMHDNIPVGISGIHGTTFSAGVVGGKAGNFGVVFPLSSLIPLRNSNVWNTGFKESRTLPIGYGTVTITPLQYDSYGYEFFLLDHAIEGVDRVLVDDKAESNYTFKNKVDSEGKAISLIIFGNAMAGTEIISVTCRGKLHPLTGVLLKNPADVLWDFLHNVCNLPITLGELSRFQKECANAGIECNGLLYEEARTIRSQIDEIMISSGAVWSGGMPGIARLYPL